MQLDKVMMITGCVLMSVSACSAKREGLGARGIRGAGAGGSAAASGGTNASDGGAQSSAGSFVVSTGGAGSSAAGVAGAPPLRDDQCARRDLSTTRIIPTVWLVLDGSGSMVSLLDAQDMASPSRWVALREALMDPAAGLVKTLEHDVKFGMLIYDGPVPGNFPTVLPDGGVAMFPSGPATSCPRLVDVEPALDNFANLDKAYPPDPLGGSTPTDKALEQVVAHLPTAGQVGPDDARVQPTLVVLATDGEPNDYCSMGFSQAEVRPRVLSAVQQLVANGNKTYVISLAGSDAGLMQFCTDVAQAGGTGKPAYVPSTRDALVQAFREIIGPGVACEVHLDGMVKPGLECTGTVELNGKPLVCASDDGWRLKDMSTITLTGSACERLRLDPRAYLHADFPCEAVQLK